MERRISALISTGDEKISFSQVESRLKKQLRQRKYNRSGSIPLLESEIAGLRENAGRTGPETISYYIEELSKLELSLRGAAEKRILLEVGLLRLCRLEDTISGSILARLEQVEGKIARGIPVAPTAAVVSTNATSRA